MQYILRNDDVIARCIEEIKRSPGMTVTIKETKRGLDQNALMWMLLTVLGKDMGYTSEQLHEVLKVRWLGVSKRIVEGIEIVEPVSTTTLTKKQFTEYIDKIYELGAIMGIVLPNPSHWGLECTD